MSFAPNVIRNTGLDLYRSDLPKRPVQFRVIQVPKEALKSSRSGEVLPLLPHNPEIVRIIDDPTCGRRHYGQPAPRDLGCDFPIARKRAMLVPMTTVAEQPRLVQQSGLQSIMINLYDLPPAYRRVAQLVRALP